MTILRGPRPIHFFIAFFFWTNVLTLIEKVTQS